MGEGAGTLCPNSTGTPQLAGQSRGLPEIPAGWLWQLGNLSLLPADPCCPSYSRMASLKVLSFQEGGKNTRGQSTQTAREAVREGFAVPFWCGGCLEQTPDSVPTSGRGMALASHLGMLPWLRGQHLLLSSGLLLAFRGDSSPAEGCQCPSLWNSVL